MPLRLVNVELDAAALAADPRGCLARLAAALPPHPGRTLLFLPPLTATVAALGPDGALASRAARAARRRPARAAMVRFAYPGASAARRAWLVAHDRTHAALRGLLADLARVTGSVVVAGTAVVGHPRTHWEAWPDEASLFHAAWCLDADGEPHAVLRHPRPAWEVLAGVPADPADASRGEALSTPVGPVAVRWDDRRDPLPAAPVVWLPRAWRAGELRAGVPAASRPREAARAAGPAVRAVVRTCLVGDLGGRLGGRSGIAVVGQGGRHVLHPVPAARDGVAWQAIVLRGME